MSRPAPLHARSRPRLLDSLPGGDERRARRRERDLQRRLRVLHRTARRADLPSDHRAFLLLALGRVEALFGRLPPSLRAQAMSLSWQESLLAALERQAAGLPPALRPFATSLPTSVADERRRRTARSALASFSRRARQERDELLTRLDEVERALNGDEPD